MCVCKACDSLRRDATSDSEYQDIRSVLTDVSFCRPALFALNHAPCFICLPSNPPSPWPTSALTLDLRFPFPLVHAGVQP